MPVTDPPRDRIVLRFRDLDAFGHVYHAEYLTFLDELRTGWFGTVLGLDDPQSYIVARVEIDYVSSLTPDDAAVHGAFAVERAGSTSVTVRESLRADDGREVAQHHHDPGARDLAAGSSRALTDRERVACAAHPVTD